MTGFFGSRIYLAATSSLVVLGSVYVDEQPVLGRSFKITLSKQCYKDGAVKPELDSCVRSMETVLETRVGQILPRDFQEAMGIFNDCVLSAFTKGSSATSIPKKCEGNFEVSFEYYQAACAGNFLGGKFSFDIPKALTDVFPLPLYFKMTDALVCFKNKKARKEIRFRQHMKPYQDVACAKTRAGKLGIQLDVKDAQSFNVKDLPQPYGRFIIQEAAPTNSTSPSVCGHFKRLSELYDDLEPSLFPRSNDEIQAQLTPFLYLNLSKTINYRRLESSVKSKVLGSTTVAIALTILAFGLIL